MDLAFQCCGNLTLPSMIIDNIIMFIYNISDISLNKLKVSNSYIQVTKIIDFPICLTYKLRVSKGNNILYYGKLETFSSRMYLTATRLRCFQTTIIVSTQCRYYYTYWLVRNSSHFLVLSLFNINSNMYSSWSYNQKL